MNIQTKSDLKAYIMAHTRERRDCLVWTGPRFRPQGYGYLHVKGKQIPAHRAAWLCYNGSIPKNRLVLHHCDNPPCVKLEHLRVGTVADNARDRTERHPKAHSEGHPKAKLTNNDVVAILLLFGSGMFKVSTLALICGVTKSHVSNIVYGYSWTHLPFQARRKRILKYDS